MSITTQCPGCRKTYAIDEKHEGRTLICKQCGGAMRVGSDGEVRRNGPRVRVECDDCGKGHWVSAENAGKKTFCKNCGTLFRIPEGVTASDRNESTRASSAQLTDSDPSSQVELDVFGLKDGAVPTVSGTSSLSGASAINGSAGDDSAPLPSRPKPYKPLSASKKKQIARRAAKLDRSRPSTAAFGVSFGAVLTFALLGWRVYRILNGFQRAAAGAHTLQAVPADGVAFDAGAAASETDREVMAMIARPGTVEARDWLDPNRYPNHAVKGMPTQQARVMVAGFYERGAESVYVLEPASIGNAVLTGGFAVKLPEDPVRRRKCLNWAAKHEDDGPTTSDLGRKYLLMMTD
jgi:RNase P subunit RPR2